MFARLRELFSTGTPKRNGAAQPNATTGPDTSAPPAPSLRPTFEAGNFCVDDYKTMKVVVIGAGMSGLVAAIRFRQYIPNLDLTVYEKESSIGGTWWTNRYPGVACDVPSHAYQYRFENKGDWSSVYAPGAEILQSMRDIVKKYKIAPYVKLSHELMHAKWDEGAGKWRLRLKHSSASGATDKGSSPQFEEVEDEADFLFMAVGTLSRWRWPDIEGLHDFKGTLVHSANWNLGGATWEEDTKDWGDKNVAVIGLGSSGLQIVSALQSKVGKLSQYARGRTWVGPPFVLEKVSAYLGRDFSNEDNLVFMEKDKTTFAQDPMRVAEFRRIVEDDLNSAVTYYLRDSPLQLMLQDMFKSYMANRLAPKPDILAKLLPNFPLACRRITPAPGYLEALTRDNVEFVSSHIKRITTEGIETMEGNIAKHDVVICATGFDTSFLLPFTVVGRNGVDLHDKWKSPYPKSYLSVCVDEFPNCFFAGGPNSCTGAGTYLAMLECQVDYAVKVAAKLQRERLKSIEVKPEAVEDFDDYLEDFFPKTVFGEKVRSWYRNGNDSGRVFGLWPGSSLHHMRTMQNPRWEDFNYERSERVKNRFYWLGNGMTSNEVTMSGDRSWYLNQDYVDPPSVPGQ